MHKFSAIAIMMMLTAPLFFVSFGTTEAAPTLPPLTPHEVKVLVVSPNEPYLKGGHYLISDLASYGFNVTQHTSDNADTVDYRSDSKTANLGQYDVVILHGGYFGRPPTNVTLEELRHFTSYGGALVVIGNALFVNETRKTNPWLWDDFFSNQQATLLIETRLGVVFEEYLRTLGTPYDHNNGTFTLTSNLITGLPSSLGYVRGTYAGSQYQMIVKTGEADQIYEFTTQDGKKTAGVTFFRNSTGATGIYVQGAYIYAEKPADNRINYFGFTETAKRSAFLASLIAYALNKDIKTVIKPQPLANIRLDSVGLYHEETYLNASLGFFDSVMDECNITPTVGFVDYLSFKPNYWQTVVPNTFSLIKGAYRDWEYSSALRGPYIDPRLMSKEDIEVLIDSVKGKYSELGIDLYSTLIAPIGRWNQTTLDAMASRSLYLLDALNTGSNSDWWNLKVNSSIVVHTSTQMLPERVGTGFAEDFDQKSLDTDSIHSSYFSQRDKIALAILNGFVGFTYYVPNFRWNEVGPYSVRTVFRNLTSEIPDVRFIPLIEAGLYFGNKWAQVARPTRDGSVIEFDIDASAVPNVVNIGKGMLWLRINANESIQEVSINGNRWFYFDEHSIRLPTPEDSVRVRVVLGTVASHRVIDSRYKVVKASFNGYRLNVSITSAENLNVSVRLSIPKAGIFSKDTWNVFCLEETQWNYNFSLQGRILEFWAISDGFTSLEVGVFWIIDQTPPWYHSDVSVSANFSGLELAIAEVILSYNLSEEWANKTTALQNELWVATIPAMPYGTLVKYRLYAYAVIGKWFVTEVFSYNVTDETAPVIDDLEWGPGDPAAGQPVKVNVAVSEPQNASGVKNVFLRYYVGTDLADIARAQTTNMTNLNGTWTAEIPGQGGGAIVTFSVVAVDNAGNSEETTATRYSVWLLPIPMWLTLLIVGAIAAASVVIALYFFKFRRAKQKVETPEVSKPKISDSRKPR